MSLTAAALRAVDAVQVAAVPVQVEGADPFAERVLGADAAEPAVVGPVAGGRHHLAERVGGVDPGAPGADHLAVLEAAERQARAGAAAGSAR